MKHFHINGNSQTKTLCRKAGLAKAAGAAEAACVNNNRERDAADWRHRGAAEVDAECVSRALEVLSAVCPISGLHTSISHPAADCSFKFSIKK